MKLLSCEISGFGKLQNFTYEFSGALSSFLKENAWGKSTLAAFIKVMLFGFDGEGKRAAADREREKYRPWSNGIYGGKLRFEAAGKTYELQKKFGNKQGEDEENLYALPTNLVSNDYRADCIGEDVLGIDAASFMRTIYIAQNDIDVWSDGKKSLSDGIHAKIGNLTDATDDINNYETVQERLKKNISQIGGKGAGSSLKKLKEEIAECENTIREKDGLEASLLQINQHIEEESVQRDALKEQICLLEEEYKNAGIYKANITAKKQYEGLTEKLKEYEKIREEKKAAFPTHIPTEDKLREAVENSRGRDRSLSKAESFTLSEEEAESLARLKGNFSEGVPLAGELSECMERIGTLSDLKEAYLQKKLTGDQAENLERLKRKYPVGCGEEKRTGELIGKWNESRKILSALPEKEKHLAYKQDEFKRGENRKRLLTVFGISLTAIGLVLLYIESAYAPAALTAALCLLVWAVALKPTVQKDELDELSKQIEEEEAFLKVAEEEVRIYLEEYRLSCKEDDVEDTLYSMKNEAGEYAFLTQKEKEFLSGNYESRMQDTVRGISGFLHTYYPEEKINENNAGDCLLRLEKDAEKYKNLKEKKKNFESACAEEEQYRQRVEAFLDEVGKKPDGNADFTEVLSRMQEELTHYKNALQQEERARAEKHAFEENHDTVALLTLSEEDAGRTMEEIGAQREQVNLKLQETEKLIRDYRNQADVKTDRLQEISDLTVYLEELYEKKESEEKKQKLLENTREYLRTAKENLTAKYTEPIQKAFEKYYRILSEESAKDIIIDANLSLTKEEFGGRREIRSLSSGLQDMILVCLRMALIDAMYTGEKPFLVFDDPFVNLDAKKLSHARAFLDEIAKEYQILYFTCHESRA